MGDRPKVPDEGVVERAGEDEVLVSELDIPFGLADPAAALRMRKPWSHEPKPTPSGKIFRSQER